MSTLSAEQRALKEWFGLRAHEARKLDELRSANGSPVVLYSKPSVAKVIACRIRSALECEAMELVRGQGYRLTSIGLAECEHVIRGRAA